MNQLRELIISRLKGRSVYIGEVLEGKWRRVFSDAVLQRLYLRAPLNPNAPRNEILELLGQLPDGELERNWRTVCDVVNTVKESL